MNADGLVFASATKRIFCVVVAKSAFDLEAGSCTHWPPKRVSRFARAVSDRLRFFGCEAMLQGEELIITKCRIIIAACVASFFAGSAAFAHHSIIYFDRTQIIEGEGEVTEIYWGNPHIRFTVAGLDARGALQVWEIETSSISTVSRFGLTADLITTGIEVRIAGNPSSVLANRVLLTNMLLPNGREILFGNGERYQARWSGQKMGEDTQADTRQTDSF